MKHRIGDTVRIKSREWYDTNKDEWGMVPCGDLIFTPDAAELCGTEQEIAEIPFDESYVFVGQDESKDMAFNDEMLEELRHKAELEVRCGIHRAFMRYDECGAYERDPEVSDDNHPCRHLDSNCPFLCDNSAVWIALGLDPTKRFPKVKI